MIAWIGSMLLTFCALPQAYKSFIEGNSKGISWMFILMWTLGELFTLAYIVQDIDSVPLLFNYGFNSAFCLVILYYKVRPRGKYE